MFKLDNLGNPRVAAEIKYNSSKSSNPANLTIVNDTLYFTLSDNDGRTQLWRETNTGETDYIEGIPPHLGYNLSNLNILNNSLYFSTTDDDNRTYFWKTNDVGDLERTGHIDSNYSYNSSNFTIVNDTLYFTTTDKFQNDILLWKISNLNGREKTERVYGFDSDTYRLSDFIDVNGILYFTTLEYVGESLWRINDRGSSVFMNSWRRNL